MSNQSSLPSQYASTSSSTPLQTQIPRETPKRVRFNKQVKTYIIKSSRLEIDEALFLSKVKTTKRKRLYKDSNDMSSKVFLPLPSQRCMRPMSQNSRWKSAIDDTRDEAPTPVVRVKSLDIVNKALQIALESDQ
jgi:hypothetical protein